MTSTVPSQDQSGYTQVGNDWILINAKVVAGIIGASFLFAWFLECLLLPNRVYLEGVSLEFIVMQQLAFLLSITFTYWVTHATSAFSKRTYAFTIIGLLFACINIAVCVYATTIDFSNVDSFRFIAIIFARPLTAGVAIGALTPLWISFFCIYMRDGVSIALQYSFALSMVWMFLLLAIDTVFAFIGLCVLILMAAVLLVMMVVSAPPEVEEFADIVPVESDKRMTITLKSELLSFVGTFAMGFALAVLFTDDMKRMYFYIIVIVLLVFAGLVCVRGLKRFMLAEVAVQRIMLPVYVVGFISMLIVPSQYVVVSAIVVFCFSFLPFILSLSATCEHIVRFNLIPDRVYCMTMIWSTAGIALGFFMGWLAFGWEPSGFDSTGLFVTLAVALTVVPWCSLFDAHSYYPGEGEDKELRLQITSEGVPLSVEQAKVDDESYLDFHHRKCAAIAEEIGLTKRQEEVLELLAKGRNSSYIQQDLVISPHTVKSHTYSIYQKAGVHSQQELMDLVEDYKL